MKEWDTPVNAFNSMKVLFHVDHLQAIANGKFLPPIATDTDASNVCNQFCFFCNSKVYRKQSGYSLMPKGHLLKLADFYAQWGVKATCIGGGGESLINKEVKKFIPYANKRGIEVGVITNGTLMDKDYAEIMPDHCRYVGMSCDCSNENTYRAMRGTDDFPLVIKNMERLNESKRKKGSSLDTNIKFLIHPTNCGEIFSTARIAKDIGCSGIHIRPMAIEGVWGLGNDGFSMTDYMEEINDQIDMAFELEGPDFKVYAVRHKFGENMEKVVRFKTCLATPMVLTFGADGWTYVCFNMRGREKMRLARHYPDPQEVLNTWGSDLHKRIIESINPSECPRCTYGTYHELIERAVINDDMFRNFV